MVAGRLGGSFGRKRIYLAGLITFTAARYLEKALGQRLFSAAFLPRRERASFPRVTVVEAVAGHRHAEGNRLLRVLRSVVEISGAIGGVYCA